jgi:hypothetical protein
VRKLGEETVSLLRGRRNGRFPLPTDEQMTNTLCNADALHAFRLQDDGAVANWREGRRRIWRGPLERLQQDNMKDVV